MPNTNEQLSREQQIAALEKDWASNPRWKGVKRGYSAADVVRLRGSLPIEHTLAKRGAEKLWRLVNGDAKKGYVNAFGAITAGQAMQQAKAGLEAVYLSGWQVAADGNTSSWNHRQRLSQAPSRARMAILVRGGRERRGPYAGVEVGVHQAGARRGGEQGSGGWPVQAWSEVLEEVCRQGDGAA